MKGNGSIRQAKCFANVNCYKERLRITYYANPAELLVLIGLNYIFGKSFQH